MILGVLLAEPSLWQGVQKDVHPADFSDDLRRRLAQFYWDHQRDEGEPVFSELLSTFNDASLTELAVELVDEVEQLPDAKDSLGGWLLYLSEVRREREGEKLVAQSRRTDADMGEQDQVSLLQKLQEQGPHAKFAAGWFLNTRSRSGREFASDPGVVSRHGGGPRYRDRQWQQSCWPWVAHARSPQDAGNGQKSRWQS